MATFVSTANEAVAEAVSVSTLASTVDEAVAKAASTADEDVAVIASKADKAVAGAASTADKASTRRTASTADKARGRCDRCISRSCCLYRCCHCRVHGERGCGQGRVHSRQNVHGG